MKKQENLIQHGLGHLMFWKLILMDVMLHLKLLKRKRWRPMWRDWRNTNVRNNS